MPLESVWLVTVALAVAFLLTRLLTLVMVAVLQVFIAVHQLVYGVLVAQAVQAW